ncbi:MAG: CRISPR-associated endonuclease Cas2 [Deltaproteobacteria bacterium]|nr:CRISPR-associated endonuclease Cas2 [Deltaproteobacteria bacterium]
MWVMVMFDLPVNTKKSRRDYARFRTYLLKQGYLRLQFSVYARPCPTEENAKVHENRIKRNLPPAGQVRMLTITDAQFGRMRVFVGKKPTDTESGPKQLEFF